MSKAPDSSSKKTSNNGVTIVFISIFLVLSLFLYVNAFSSQRDSQFDDLLSAIRGVAGGQLNLTSAANVQPLEVSDGELDRSVGRASALLSRTEAFLSWATNTNATDGKAAPYVRWDLVSNADIHIAHKLAQYLRFHLGGEAGRRRLVRAMKSGYQCSPLQAAQQEFIAKHIKMDICSEVEWYKLAQLAWPQAKVFFDVGANKGYLGALFLSLWGGGGLKASPAELFAIAKRINAWKGSRNPAGYCRDGLNFAIASHCEDERLRDERTGRCNAADASVRVYSLDGSSYLTKTLSGIISSELFPGAPQPPWSYSNFAVSNVEGTARFTKQSQEKNAGFEGGGIRPSAPQDETEEVPMTTADAFAQQQGVEKVDLLKIDTEGNDNNVLLGAERMLQEQTGMFAFEGGKGITFSKEMIDRFDDWGYNCYSTSRAGLFKWNGGCMKEKYMGGFRAKDKGNIFCVHRQRAELAALAYDVLSFPAIAEFVLKDLPSAGAALTKGQAEVAHFFFNQTSPKGMNVDIDLVGKIDLPLLTDLYVNIHGFCKPWPACAKV